VRSTCKANSRVTGYIETVKIGDLIIAATAERGGLVVLHYDRDFDRIGDVTHQPTEWVVPAGAADSQ
jgi:predicted nucleic acid-binding protein